MIPRSNTGFSGFACLLLGLAMVCLSFIYTPTVFAEDFNKAFLVNEDFSGRDLSDSSFTKANLKGANLSQTNLQAVSFFGANLEAANLEGADLTNATLDSARLVGANLTNANLEGAFAFNAKFNNATIDGADFTEVMLRDDMHDLLCKVAQGTNPTTGRATRDTLECY
ncbi:pentapeptide repeat-containing protein [Phormidium tenue FACHB-886]|nr:pentapeptide repeat-containing protein [Phormidium tenue FACHB-886]